MSRKKLITLIAFSIAAFVILFFLFLQNQKYVTFESETFAMDTFIVERIYGGDGERVSEVSGEIIAELDLTFDRYDDESEIYALNNSDGEFVALSEYSIEILSSSKEYSRMLNGRFDITIGRIMDIYNEARDTNSAIDNAEIEEALVFVNSEALEMAEGGASLAIPGMSVDLGAVAKGYLCDKLEEVYRENGVTSAIVNVGGSILAVGTNPDGESFKVGIRDPQKSDSDYLGVLELTDEIISTSGGYERFFESGGEVYHHIIDPRTGYPSESDLLSVAVIGQSGIECDVMSTYLFIMGSEEVLKHIDDYNLLVIAVTEDKEVIVSEGLRERFSLNTDNEYKLYER